MKKIKQIETYYCDYCGKECDHTEFIIPSLEPVCATNKAGARLLSTCFKEMRAEKKNICKECQKKIAYVIPLISNMTVKDGNVKITINN